MAKIEKLSEADIRDRVGGLDGWALDGNALRKSFRFEDFRGAFAFMTGVALLAEKQDHHPNWSNVYNRVEIALSTHDAGSITERDFKLARAIDALGRSGA